MRSLSLPALVALAALACSCSHDTMSSQPMSVVLRHDGNNDTAPNLPAASYEAGARFTAAEVATVAGGRLTQIEFYLSLAPAALAVKVYGQGTASTPGALLYSADLTGAATGFGWNTHVLPAPLAVPAGDLWVVVAFSHAGTQRTIGCDAGPGVADGDWLWASTDGNWTRFSQRYAISINWNIRATVDLP